MWGTRPRLPPVPGGTSSRSRSPWSAPAAPPAAALRTYSKTQDDCRRRGLRPGPRNMQKLPNNTNSIEDLSSGT